MTRLVPMAWETYNAQSAELASVVDAMIDRPDWLKRWRLLAIYESGGAHELIGTVLALGDGAVLVARITNDYDSDDLTGGDDLRQAPTRLLQPITGDPEQRFEMASRRTQFMVSARYLIEAIEAGDTTVALTPGWTR